MDSVPDIVGRIARRDRQRSEATLQSDIRALILRAGLNLSGDDVVDVNSTVTLEAQVGDGTRRRIDIETGSTVIEVKKSLSNAATVADAVKQLGAYVHTRVQQTRARFLGVLTDGRTWKLYVPDPDSDTRIIEAGQPLTVDSAADADKLVDWLGAILATVEQIRPKADVIEQAFGSSSPAYAADHATLAALFSVGSTKPELRLKRRLWSKLLRTAFGSAFEDDETLFVDHTLLVIIAEIIAHAVIGLDVSRTGGLSADELVSGSSFERAAIHGVVEADFFDWPTLVPGGTDFIRSLAHRISRFDWNTAEVDHDVLKHLYESIISPESRRSLGEYYTPDWLADQMVSATVSEPASQRVLDPSCGSGTFVFHAVRRHLEASEEAGASPGAAVESAVLHVFGMDVHPVAVTLARVTYLLALGTTRLLHKDRGEISVPVFLGDSIQWEQRRDLFAEHGAVTIHTDDHELVEGGGGTLFTDDLVFPADVVNDAVAFDRLVRELAEGALDTGGSYDRTLVDPILVRNKINDPEQRRVLTQTFSTLRGLHRTGNDHIWSYYVRNLVRPLWLTMEDHRVDVLVGNPPWLRFSNMTEAMQERYLTLSRERRLLTGPLGASSRDLSTLFVVRAIELYLRDGGEFAFVMPHGIMTRKPHAGFRSGRWVFASSDFSTAWDLGPSSRATGFPLPSCVIRGAKRESGTHLSPQVERWTVRTSRSDRAWAEIAPTTVREPASVYVLSPGDPEPESPYASRFRAGAIIYPRVLFFITDGDAGPLGVGAGRTAVVTRPSEKVPWRSVAPLVGVVETEFIHPVHLGETILPYKALEPARAVIPINPTAPSRMLSLIETQNFSALRSYWAQVEETWRVYRKSSERLDLIERVDYSRQLSSQFPPGKHDHRVVYTASGNSLAAARLEGEPSLIEHKLYWAPAASAAEARYLVGVINSRAMHEAVTPMQSLGLFGTRDFDKLVFRVPFPAFDPKNPDHLAVAELTRTAEVIADRLDVSGVGNFKVARAIVRQALIEDGVAAKIESAVEKVIPVVSL